jgi:hypothetical protein
MLTNTGSHLGKKTTLKRNYFFDCTIFIRNSGPVPTPRDQSTLSVTEKLVVVMHYNYTSYVGSVSFAQTQHKMC